MKIKILGSGCQNCKILEANTKKAVEDMNIKATIEKVTDVEKIIEYGVMATPAIVVDEVVVSYGRVLSPQEIKRILE